MQFELKSAWQPELAKRRPIGRFGLCTDPIVSALMHPVLRGKRIQQAFSAAKPHPDIPRPADVALPRRLLLARVGQAVAIAAREQFG
jgi:hypothetical protein